MEIIYGDMSQRSLPFAQSFVERDFNWLNSQLSIAKFLFTQNSICLKAKELAGLAWLTVITCFIFSHARAQQHIDFPTKTNITSLGSHTNLKNTRLFIKVPSDFRISSEYPMVQKGPLVMIHGFVYPDSNYSKFENSFNSNPASRNKLDCLIHKKVTINNYTGRFVSFQSGTKLTINVLAFGDSTFTALLMAFYPSGMIKIKKEVQQLMASVYYDKRVPVDPFANTVFQLDHSKTTFNSRSFNGSFFEYKAVDNTTNHVTVLTVYQTPKAGRSAEQILDNSLKSLSVNGFIESEIRNFKLNKVQNLDGLTREVHGSLNGKKQFYFQQVLFIDKYAVVFQGLSEADHNISVANFQSLINTIRPKKKLSITKFWELPELYKRSSQ